MNKDIIQERRDNLEQFAKESYPVIIDFAERLEHHDPSSILLNSEAMTLFVGTVAEFMQSEPVDAETRVWISVRIGYLIGEYLIQKYEGHWGVNLNENSPQYGHYVVFAISPTNSQKAYPVDPFEAANEFVNQEPDRDLISLIEEIELMIK
ncbi:MULTISPECIES: hypothetical protein [unclassified Aureispira]|uniref:hypothetical protein n=1 Tax=unclassified Aureispira TaxID=2649989 RepID=UPI000695CB42|nr:MULTISPECIES: hypothetical protein [unclassified Aureispira]WMX13482.1 hypothetical protein QP953_21780 [Aureispira sp. CCB-E]